jgi:hypothetical protein
MATATAADLDVARSVLDEVTGGRPIGAARAAALAAQLRSIVAALAQPTPRDRGLARRLLAAAELLETRR